MKKKVAAVLGFLCSAFMAAGLASCGGSTPVTYTLDSADFNATVVFGTTIDYSALVIEGSNGSSIPVTESMVSGLDTSSVGDKILTVSYEGKTMTVNYTVKYEVKFVVDGATVDTQYVVTANEIDVPDAYETYEWTPSIPQTITDNMTFEEKEEEVPSDTISVSFGTEGVFEMNVGSSGAELGVTVSDGTWEVDTSNDNITVRKLNGLILVSADKAGVTEVTVRATNADGAYGEATKRIVVKPGSLTIAEAAATYGIEKIRTIGRTDVNDKVSETKLTASYDESKAGEGFAENIVWESSNALASINNDGVITLGAGNGASEVSFTAKFKVDGVEYSASAPYTLRCVWDGVNVKTYADLYAATKAEKVIVLGADIAFPTNKDEIKYETVHTTYDDTYYKNINKVNEATIKVLLQFKNDLYGNGYEINAHNATLGLLDSTGAPTNALFKGPLDFVSLTESGSSLASVKGQDNVCFGVYEGVTLNNVVLKAANLEEDLTELNYAGTTVEVFGDGVTIEYSRIMNGRTVLRVFGDPTDANKVINVTVKNSVLSGAREFILRMGSNAFVDGEDGNVSPYLTNDQLDLIGIKSGAVKKAADYEEKYIKTFVNVENSVFRDAGIFAVGIDSHFAGEALHDGSDWESWFTGFSNWHDLAKTSYGAKLTFSGEVKLYNWKKVDEIDSSTLIELGEGLADNIKKMLTFDVGALVDLAAKQPGYETIMDENRYVHAGIAFFGGGKNYGLFEDKTNMGLAGFEVDLGLVDKSTLKTAAGTEKFYFNIYDTESNFKPADQDKLLNAGEETAYSCIYNK